MTKRAHRFTRVALFALALTLLLGQLLPVLAEDSLYRVVSKGATNNLTGRTFALINTYTNSALQAQASQSGRLAAQAVQISGNSVSSSSPLSLWTFESDSANTYYLRSGDNYLYINNTQLTLSSQKQGLKIGTDANRSGQVRILNGNYAVRKYDNNISSGFNAANTSNNNAWFTLYEVQPADYIEFPAYDARKISVQDLENNQEVVIYRSIYDESTGVYEDFVIDGSGNMVRAYDKGDRVTLRSEVSPVWKLILHRDEVTGEPNGYYDFYNESTGMYLSPQSDGTKVSSERPGLTLNGRRDGAYSSTIEKWDGSVMQWYGYNAAYDSTVGGSVLSTGMGAASQSFSFAAVSSETTPNVLHPVSTVDSKAAGVTIRMFNYPNRDTIKNITGYNDYTQSNPGTQHIEKRLVNGYPVFTNGKSGSGLFSPSNSYYKGEANHLFLSSVYNATGYYEYNAFNNFAHYDSGNFTVYKEIGTPRSDDDRFFFKRGNFYPYNNLDPNSPAVSTNMYDGSGNILDTVDPNRNGRLYTFKEGVDYYFGMTVEADFMQPKDGFEKGSPMVFEFNGDDDMWVFVDGVLLMDIGGVHDALPGTINFQTGQIAGSIVGGTTTIKQCFKNAGVFPDGTPWADNKVDQYFNGDTFVDYSSHNFKMFYMEHGAGASNLDVRFNLPVIHKGRISLEKELTNTDQQRFANVSFAFQAFKVGENGGEDVPLTEAVFEGTEPPVSIEFFNNVDINGKSYDNVFYLKPGQVALFPELDESQEYYVRELGVDKDHYEKIIVNNVEIDDGEAMAHEDGIYTSPIATVGQRILTVYNNTVSEKNLNDLRIKKIVSEHLPDLGATFEFRVLLEDADGNLSPYSTGPYSIVNDKGEYFRYVDGQLTSNGYTPVTASVSGNNGSIAGIPAGYTVLIGNLLDGTDFYVEEIRLPEPWQLAEKVVVEGSCGSSTLTGTGFDNQAVTADGQIILDHDAEVDFTNTLEAEPTETVVSGQKILNGRDMAAGEFTFRLEPLSEEQGGAGLNGETALTATSAAARQGEASEFTFPKLTFTLDDYLQATEYTDEGDAVFYYLVTEDPGTVEDVVYSDAQFLVTVTLHLDMEDGYKLTLTQAVSAYTGEEEAPGETATEA